MRDRIKRPADKEVLFNKLKEGSQNKDGFFPTFKDLLVFAAALGYKYNTRIPFSENLEPIHLSVFQNEEINFIDILALGETADINIIDPNDEEAVEKKLLIFEEYANGGLELLDRKIFRDAGTIYINFLGLVIEEVSSGKTEKPSETDLGNLIDIENL